MADLGDAEQSVVDEKVWDSDDDAEDNDEKEEEKFEKDAI